MSRLFHHALTSQYKISDARGEGSLTYISAANCVTPEVVIYGKCVQSGTPSPDAPVKIACNSNSYDCGGKNLVPFPYEENNVTRKGISYTVNSDGGIHAKGTADGTSYFKIATLYLGDEAIDAMNKESATNGVYTASKQLYYNAASNMLSLNFVDGTIVDEVFYPQVEHGTVATPYEPYFNGGTVTAPKLYAVGDVRDEYYPLTGKIVRRCGIIELDSSFDLRAYTYQERKNGVVCYNAFENGNVVPGLICSHEGNYAEVETDYTFMFINENLRHLYWVGILDVFQVSVSAFKSWLDEQKAAGTPVILVYALAKPVVEYVAPVTLTSKRGANTITEEGSMTGTEIGVKYLSHS